MKKRPDSLLTEKQLKILRLLAQGKPYQEICKATGFGSVSTLQRNGLKGIYRKLRAENKYDAIVIGTILGLVVREISEDVHREHKLEIYDAYSNELHEELRQLDFEGIQLEILRLVAENKKNHELMEKLPASKKKLRRHLKDIYIKLKLEHIGDGRAKREKLAEIARRYFPKET